MQNVTQINMGMIKSDIEIILNERDIKAFPIIRYDDLVYLDVLYKIIQVLSMDIGLNRLTVI